MRSYLESIFRHICTRMLERRLVALKARKTIIMYTHAEHLCARAFEYLSSAGDLT